METGLGHLYFRLFIDLLIIPDYVKATEAN